VAGEEMGLFFSVVDSRDQDIFEVDPLLFAAGVIVAGRKQSR
jgi:hypothetical protein